MFNTTGACVVRSQRLTFCDGHDSFVSAFGLVLVEALACGTPAIAFGRGSVPEIIDDGVTGFIVNCVDEAVDAVKKIGSIDRAHCRAAFEKRFTAARMAGDYLNIYRKLCERTQRLYCAK